MRRVNTLGVWGGTACGAGSLVPMGPSGDGVSSDPMGPRQGGPVVLSELLPSRAGPLWLTWDQVGESPQPVQLVSQQDAA